MSLKADLEHHPLVSVIIPTFNSEKQLPICLESIKNQTYQNIEIIIETDSQRIKLLKLHFIIKNRNRLKLIPVFSKRIVPFSEFRGFGLNFICSSIMP